VFLKSHTGKAKNNKTPRITVSVFLCTFEHLCLHCYTPAELNTDNGKIGPWSRDLLDEQFKYSYGVATISRLLKIIGLFCKRAL